ncbi:regulator of telomere elongation helicase 1-like isoform X1 [Oreochromis aureus]|uniref:regulator of telomere elongation helicase 1-like isoform X1 n=2 Tax=Oreochromis aureus TaxID=47969 RepID=UPI001954079A|nr:regulator of telomere elongation helicase 1-like isoform X1 [Oreochromis aureus]
MPSLTLRGVTVNFPFSPYESQKAYMNKVIECLQEKVNAVLESPTGTGKTLCLLCTTLAWRENFKDTMSTCMMAEMLGQEMFPNTPLSSWGTADGDKLTYYTDVPKIIYATRTHSQLAQVINELKNTSYSPKVCVLGSREQLCINQDVMCQKSNHVKVHMCRGKVSTGSCVYYKKVEEKSTDRDFVSSILDVEDLVQFGNKQSFIYEVFEKANLTFSSKTAVFEALEHIIGYLAQQPGIFLNTSGLQKLSDIIQLVFCGEPSEKEKQHQMETNTAHFKVHIHRNTSIHSKKPSVDMWASGSSKKQGNILSYWCFSPAFSMQDLVNQGIRCIILTSGTLSPLSSFTSEMRIEFPVCLENSHVIERDQIFVGVIAQGPDGVPLSSAFDRRFVPENMASLGNTVANLSRLVPHGLLVFFPSFPSMEKALEFWRANGHANRIEKLKPMFVEPTEKGTFNEVIDGYYTKVNDPRSKGGAFFGVCRGKASEGLDFADMFGRGVIITGLPFPPKKDPRVVLKMQFLDEMNQKKSLGQKYLSGQEWYRQQAFRAVNQAIGRVIRHKEDYGAIFLCDQRFKNADTRAMLPSWVRSYVRLYDSFGSVVRDVSQFFRTAQKMRPVVGKKAPAHNHETDCSRDTQSSSFTSRRYLQTSHTQKAKVLDIHLPSLKRRRLNEKNGANDMASFLNQYEVPYDNRRPLNLLDALEQANNTIEEDKREQKKLGVPEDLSQERKSSRAKKFLADMKKSLSQVCCHRIMRALHTYEKTDDLDHLLTETAFLGKDANTQSLLHGLCQFVRPHHKKRFDENSQEMAKQGCGYKPDHTLSKDGKKTVTLQNDKSK